MVERFIKLSNLVDQMRDELDKAHHGVMSGNTCPTFGVVDSFKVSALPVNCHKCVVFYLCHTLKHGGKECLNMWKKIIDRDMEINGIAPKL